MRAALAAASTLALLVAVLATGPVLAAPPTAGNDQVSTPEDTPVVIDLLRNDTDPDGDALAIQSVADPPFGSTAPGPTAGSIVYTPDRDYESGNGPDRFQYTVVDANGETATALVTVFVTRVNDPPVAEDRFYTVPEDGSIEVLFVGLDPDKERCDLIFQVEHHTAFGLVGDLSDAGCVEGQGDLARAIYTPFAGYHGADSIQYSVNDGTVSSSAGVVSITVTPVDDVPQTFDTSATTTSGAPVVIILRGLDWETCELSFQAAIGPSHGTLSALTAVPCGPGGPVDPNVDSATITYTPVAGFSGSDTFTFAASDGTTWSTPSTVTITVSEPPTIHVGDLDATSAKVQKGWIPSVTVAIHTAIHGPVAGAIVRGAWSTGGTGTCTTAADGRCGVTGPVLANKVKSTAFTVTSVTATGRTHAALDAHDPDGDSTGTTITIPRP